MIKRNLGDVCFAFGGSCALGDAALHPGVIERWLANVANLVPLVATCNDRIVGHAQILKYPHPQRKGTSDLIICPHQDFHNTGLDLAMLTKLVELAKKEGLHRIGLQVVADNNCAVYLYEKLASKSKGR